MKNLLLITTLIFTVINGFSQVGQRCIYPNPTDENLKQISNLLQSSSKSGTKRIIPIVFHVLHQNGIENISEAQILDQMQILNEDFQKLNADTIDIVSPFDTIFDAPNFEFRLATIDPNGNPTNGIDRIYTSLTNNQYPFITVNPWPSERYVNIWVNRSSNFGLVNQLIGDPYSPNNCSAGVAMLHNYIGSIGTSSTGTSRALTHEMGHYFGLFHIWDSSYIVLPTLCTFSDGLPDTPFSIQPITICDTLANTCDDTQDPSTFAYWGYDVIDNTQNFMSWSYCSKMFTNMQADLMRSVGENPLYGRYNLHTDSNLVATGTGPGPIIPATNLPYNEFTVDQRMNCAGDSVHFFNSCGNPLNTTYLWNFPGGSPSSSILPNPSVFYPSNGFQDVTLSVTNPNGTTTLTKTFYMQIVGSWAEYVGPTSQVFDSLSPFWLVQNHEVNSTAFELIPTQGVQNSACYKLTNQFLPDTSIACWNQVTSSGQLIGNKDDLISPAFDLRTTSNVTISFDYAYGSASNPSAADEKLILYSTRNCGQTWIQRAQLTNTNLITSSAPQGSDFIPNASQWQTKTINYVVNNQDDKTRFRLEFTASDSSNNLFIDNFIVSGILKVGSEELNALALYPNPVKSGQFFNIEVGSKELNIESIELFDSRGSKVLNLNANEVVENGGFNINLQQGYYFLKIENQNGFRMEKVIIQ